MPSKRSSVGLWILGGIAVLMLMGKRAYGFTVKDQSVVVPPSEEMQYAADVVARVWQAHGFTAVLTSGLDGEHREDSLHYAGLATDWRTKNLPVSLKSGMIAEVRAILGRDFDVLLEYVGLPNEHMHIEFDPK